MAGATGTVENPLEAVFAARMGGGDAPREPETPAPSEPSGDDFLTRYFSGTSDQKSDDVAADASSAPREGGSGAQPSGTPSGEQEPPDARRDSPSFDPSSPLFQEAVNAGVQAHLRQVQLQAEAERQQKALEGLSDAEYGRLFRSQSRLLAERQALATDIGAQFYRQAWDDVMSHPSLPELKDANLNPQEYHSYADIIVAVVNHVVNARAEKLADEKVEKKVEAKLRGQMRELAKAHPEVNFGGPNTAAGRSSRASRDGMSGNQLLEAAFAARGG